MRSVRGGAKKKVQVNFSIDYDIFLHLSEECSRQEISLSHYIRRAINTLGPLTDELAQEIRQRRGMGQESYEFFEARKGKGNEYQLGRESETSFSHATDTESTQSAGAADESGD